MDNLYKEMVALLQRGESFAVATISDTSGATPRDTGAKMIVRADGPIIGTIGGGRLEARAVSRAWWNPCGMGATVRLFGVGHLSQKIAPLSESVGFKTVVLDDRADDADRERFAEPVDIRVIDSFKTLPQLHRKAMTRAAIPGPAAGFKPRKRRRPFRDHSASGSVLDQGGVTGLCDRPSKLT